MRRVILLFAVQCLVAVFTAASSLSYSNVTMLNVKAYPTDPMYDPNNAANNSAILVEVSGSVRTTTQQEINNGGTFEVHVVEANITGDVFLDYVDAKFPPALGCNIGKVVTWHAAACLYTDSAGKICGGANCTSGHDITWEVPPSTDNGPKVIVTPSKTGTFLSMNDCVADRDTLGPPDPDCGGGGGGTGAATPLFGTAFRILLALMLVSAAAWTIKTTAIRS